jgi:DNA-binding NtrC family response regulator
MANMRFKCELGRQRYRHGGLPMNQHSKPIRISVVDDENVIASTLTLILRIKGFDATAFNAPLDALKAARIQAPDVLISDVVMPQCSGIDLAILMKNQCPNCKILLFSGQAATADLLQTASDAGHHFEIMLKPVHPAEILRKIAEVTAENRINSEISVENLANHVAQQTMLLTM